MNHPYSTLLGLSKPNDGMKPFVYPSAKYPLKDTTTHVKPHAQVLDICCGSKMFWFNKEDERAVFSDRRDEYHILCDGRSLEIKPDIIADFTHLPFDDNSFSLVVFDPPHMTSLGSTSWMAKKYGRLTGDWKNMIRKGFEEAFRVLKPNGTLVFKWNESDVKRKEVLELSPHLPLFGHTTGRQAKTIWATFIKP